LEGREDVRRVSMIIRIDVIERVKSVRSRRINSIVEDSKYGIRQDTGRILSIRTGGGARRSDACKCRPRARV
jgi:hypothetical protein